MAEQHSPDYQQRRRVVVTGIGLVCGVGKTVPEVWAGLLAGKSGMGPIRRFNATLHTTRFGEIGTRGPTNPALDQKYKARWITDANVSLPVVPHFGITLGVNNIADVYPSENIPANNNFGILPYTGFSPFGFNGRFMYVRGRWER